MRFVPQKTVEQQDLQCLHRVRSRLVACRTQLINQIRGLLAEYGIVLPQHSGQVRRGLPTVLEDAENQLTGAGRELFRRLYEELTELDEKNAADDRIQVAFQTTPNCQRIAAVEGVGPLIATAVVAAISNGHAFENGRQFSAWLGLVPRQNSSGGKSRLLGISKRGDPYLRTLLIHGARSVVYRAKACVAVANKNDAVRSLPYSCGSGRSSPRPPRSCWRTKLACDQPARCVAVPGCSDRAIGRAFLVHRPAN